MIGVKFRNFIDLNNVMELYGVRTNLLCWVTSAQLHHGNSYLLLYTAVRVYRSTMVEL